MKRILFLLVLLYSFLLSYGQGKNIYEENLHNNTYTKEIKSGIFLGASYAVLHNEDLKTKFDTGYIKNNPGVVFGLNTTVNSFKYELHFGTHYFKIPKSEIIKFRDVEGLDLSMHYFNFTVSYCLNPPILNKRWSLYGGGGIGCTFIELDQNNDVHISKTNYSLIGETSFSIIKGLSIIGGYHYVMTDKPYPMHYFFTGIIYEFKNTDLK